MVIFLSVIPVTFIILLGNGSVCVCVECNCVIGVGNWLLMERQSLINTKAHKPVGSTWGLESNKNGNQ